MSPYCVHVSRSDNNIVFTGHTCGMVLRWSIQQDASVLFSGHTDQVNSMTTNSSGHRLYTASSDRSVRAWDVATGSALWSYRAANFVQSLRLLDGLLYVGINESPLLCLHALTGAVDNLACTSHAPGYVQSILGYEGLPC
jgi:WD40 repeat protein